MRNPVQKVQRAVERVDDPAMRLVAAFACAAFFAQKTITRSRMRELLAQDFLGALIRGGYEIGRPFQGGLQVLNFAEVALEGAACLARGLDHHVEEGGAKHGRSRDEKPDACAKAYPASMRGLDRRTHLLAKASCKDGWIAASRHQGLPKLASARAGGHGGCGLPADGLRVKSGAGATL